MIFPSAHLRRTAFAFLAAAALAACAHAPGVTSAAAPDLIINGGPIYTGKGAERVEAVAVRDGAVIAAGANATVLKLAGAKTALINLDGGALYPGFTDGHAHLREIGLRELTLNLEGVPSIAKLVDIVRQEVAKTQPGAVVSGRGWIETGWPEKRFVNRRDLDPVSLNNPVILHRADGHALVANSVALARAGVTAQTKDPAGGRIERDAAGEPTGLLIDNAMSLLAALEQAPSEAERAEAFKVGAKVYAAYGWTGVHNMSVDPADVALMERLAGAGDLPIRVYNALDPSGLDWLAKNAPRTDKTGRVITRAVKIYADGALGSRGAALLAPYADQPTTSGLVVFKDEEMTATLALARAKGVQVAAHAIGDKANRMMIDYFEKALAGAKESPRWRIEHAQIIDPADIPRFGRDKIIASMQPSHAISDMYFAPARLGPDRLAGAYAWKSLRESRALIVGGSDAPVERGDPRIEFYAAVARRALNGFQGPDWRPQEALSRAEALALFTAAPAYASFQEAALGAIAPGKRADFTGFSRDIMTIPEADILTVKPILTVVDGVIVYRAGGGTP